MIFCPKSLKHICIHAGHVGLSKYLPTPQVWALLKDLATGSERKVSKSAKRMQTHTNMMHATSAHATHAYALARTHILINVYTLTVLAEARNVEQRHPSNQTVHETEQARTHTRARTCKLHSRRRAHTPAASQPSKLRTRWTDPVHL